MVYCPGANELTPCQQGSWGQHGAHLGPTGPRWTPYWPHKLCYLGIFLIAYTWENQNPCSITKQFRLGNSHNLLTMSSWSITPIYSDFMVNAFYDILCYVVPCYSKIQLYLQNLTKSIEQAPTICRTPRIIKHTFYGLVQYGGNSIANALDFLQSCIKPSPCSFQLKSWIGRGSHYICLVSHCLTLQVYTFSIEGNYCYSKPYAMLVQRVENAVTVMC